MAREPKTIAIPETQPIDNKPSFFKRRRKTIITLAVILFLIFLIYNWIGSFFKEHIPDVESGSVLVISPEGPVYEYNRNRISLPNLYTRHETLLDLIMSLKKAAVDNRIRGIVLQLGYSNIQPAQAADLRESIHDFRKSGKKIYAFSHFYSLTDYYIATACDKIYIMPYGMLDLRGLAMTRTYLKGTLDKIGVKAEFVRIKEYKSYPDRYTASGMSKYDREQRTRLLETVYGEYVNAISKDRGIEPETLKSFMENPAEIESLANKRILEFFIDEKLLDAEMHMDQVINLFKKNDKEEQKTINHSDYRDIPASIVGLNKGPAIALVYAIGGIIDGKDVSDYQGTEMMGSETLYEYLDLIRTNKNIKAVVLRVDSPGGSGTASERIARGIAMIQESGKPVVVSMAGVAASGGYYISAGADKIVAQNATITGSIGIFAGRFDFSGLYKKIDLKKETIKIGKYADIFNETRPATEDELNLIRKIIDDFYTGFLKHVSKGRKISEEQVNLIGRGRVWSGKDAKENKLVDEIGGINKAIDVAKELAGIKPEEDIHLVLYPERKGFFQILFGQKGKRTIQVDVYSYLSEIIPRDLVEIFDIMRILSLKENSYHPYMMMEDFYSFN